MQYLNITGVFIIVCLVNITGLVFAEEISNYQANLNLVERFARFEEGQKAIVTEMRTRFKAVDQRFEMLIQNIDKRFEAVDKRFEMLIQNIDKRFEAVDKRFEMFEKRFDSIDNRFNAMSNQITTLFMLFSAIIAAIIALIAYMIWDRRTVMAYHEKKYHVAEPVEKKASEPAIVLDTQNANIANQKVDEGFNIPKKIQDDLRNVVNYMNQFPEMRPILQPA